MENTQRVRIRHIIVFSLNVLTVNEERYFILQTTKPNQHKYFKGILTSKFRSKDMLTLKRGSTFVSTEDKIL